MNYSEIGFGGIKIMAICRTNSARELLSFLENHSFKAIPPELWDCYLWLYGKLLNPLSSALSDFDLDKSRMYVVKEADVLQGIAYCEFKQDTLTLYIDALNPSIVEQIILFLIDEGLNINSISFRDQILAEHFLYQHSNYKLVDAVHKYYIDQINFQTINSQVRELNEPDSILFEHIYGWDDFSDWLREGIRYFGFISDKRCLSIAGVTKLTKSRSEIIALQTFDEEDRRKGYAYNVCLKVIAEGLQESSVCTWTANASNLGSRKLADILGFKPFDSHFVLKKKAGGE